MPESGACVRYARRALLRAAVFESADSEFWAHRPAIARSVVTGVIAKMTPEAIVVHNRGVDQFLALAPDTAIWLGKRVTPAALRPGDQVIVRRKPPGTGADPSGPGVAERIWAKIGRVAGTITAADGREFLVDTGRGDRPFDRVVVAKPALRQVQVRFPRLTPGYLIDVIGTRHGDYLLAVSPATSQPPYRAGHQPAPPLASGRITAPVGGTAVWHEPGDEQPDMCGLGYPALDPDTDGRPGEPGSGQGCVRLPLLSIGAAVRIRNECTGRTAVLPVTSYAAAARQFCDRCLECGTSPRGRVADLTMAAFVDLGGNLEDNCFNAALALAG